MEQFGDTLAYQQCNFLRPGWFDVRVRSPLLPHQQDIFRANLSGLSREGPACSVCGFRSLNEVLRMYVMPTYRWSLQRCVLRRPTLIDLVRPQHLSHRRGKYRQASR